ncbi:MAG: DoxX family protein [Ilumatobacter sp.]|uniref:DoxX family protein n=1 Tax=Ilumatobacter sp. TaxID=1967498 RepID=UPI0032979C97
MIGTRTIARSLLASAFVVLGAKSLMRSGQLGPVAEQVTDPLTDAAGVDTNPEKLVQLNAGVQIAGGALLALGIAPRPAALALGASLVPTTLASHRFWESDTPMQKELDTMGFVKNAAILGGLIFAALDTGGRPSVFWSGKRAVANAADAVSGAAQHAYTTVTN